MLRQAEHVIIMHTRTHTLVPHVHSAVSHSHPHVEMLACSQYEQYQSWQLLSIPLYFNPLS